MQGLQCRGKTFGYQRIELLIGLLKAISLILIGLFALCPSLGFFLQYARNYMHTIQNQYDMPGLPIFIASLISIRTKKQNREGLSSKRP